MIRSGFLLASVGSLILTIGCGSNDSGPAADQTNRKAAEEVLEKLSASSELPSVGDKKTTHYSVYHDLSDQEECEYLISETFEVTSVTNGLLEAQISRSSVRGSSNPATCPEGKPGFKPNFLAKGNLSDFLASAVRDVQQAILPDLYTENNSGWAASAKVIESKEILHKNARVQLVKMEITDRRGRKTVRWNYVSLDSYFLGLMEFYRYREGSAFPVTMDTISSYSIQSPKLAYP